MSLEKRLQRTFREAMDSGQLAPKLVERSRLVEWPTSPSPVEYNDLREAPTRRSFLEQSLAAGGALALAVTFANGRTTLAQTAAAEANGEFAPNAFVRISPENTVKIIAMHDEMGQGIHTGLAIAVCEELEIDVSKVTVEPAPADVRYRHLQFGIQMTGGSTSMMSAREAMRQAGATAREMLVTAAAKQWSVEPSRCIARDGAVRHRDSTKSLSYGELASAAAKLDVPKNVPLKDPQGFTRIGKPTRRVDSSSKTRGTAIFSYDHRVDGMLTAMIERCPHFGGKLVRFDDSQAKQVDGVKAVCEVPAGVAIVAVDYWSALKGRRALQVEWATGRGPMIDSDELRTQYHEMVQRPGRVAESEGDTEQSLADNETMESTYELPFQAHAPMEPLSCLITLNDDGGANLVTGSQLLGLDRQQVAARLGVDQSKVTLENSYLGGAFGRRANPESDFVIQAVDVALAAKKEGVRAPIKTVWTREDDIRGGWYRPMYVHTLTAAIKDGKIDAWRHRVVGQSPIIGTLFEPAIVKDGLDTWAVEGATKLPYDIPNRRIELQTVRLAVPVQWWRSVGHSHTAFAKESFVDECAEKLNRDPLDLRRELLKDHPRLLRVLNTAAEKSNWNKPLPQGRGRGISVHESFESFSAHVVEASVENGVPKIHRITIAIDCGPVVNPDQVKAQMEGAANFALSAVLEGEITFKDGKVVQSNFDDFRVVRMHEAPEIDVHIVESTDPMGGIGEVGVPGVASAVCSAISDACGQRIRRLPIGDQLT